MLLAMRVNAQTPLPAGPLKAAERRMPNVQIVAACDLDIDRARAAAARAYTAVDAMLDAENLDFVDTPTGATVLVSSHPFGDDIDALV